MINLLKKIDDVTSENHQLKYKYEELEKKYNYLLYYIKKFLDKIPKVIKDIVDKVFIGNMSIDSYKSQYDPETLERHNKMVEEKRKRHGLSL